jgi:tRNA U34 5-methylaminomethyl-2-thiouridine-forming methyltransferase MnmC
MKPYKFVLKRTADGYDTLYSAEMDESYHSVNGAVKESTHVFIEAGLRHVKLKQFKVFEVGFGTGLNALLTWGEAHKNQLQIEYDAIEAFPISGEHMNALNYRKLDLGLPPSAFLHLHLADWNEAEKLEDKCFKLTKILGDFCTYSFTKKYDLVYYDAFAPEKQFEMWNEPLFKKIHKALNLEGIFVTYCAKGDVRRSLENVGFKVERLPGPPGKREMIRATKRG